ncbi:hypothetical protein BUALT_Bualt13G0091300 [Buddleja alternifolia]|uniref:Uncharacterized protein n=1 Tax=Buddleja alternifolia TaxID=168488 RepID=A0AAV6WL86_9LAMI|nr:hypothetical protein BUALT_Bualt13G0091300 [Buddleja alternifolia]
MPVRSRTRTRNRSGIPTGRRVSPCYRHPDDPISGICASCLRERLSGLDAIDASPPQLRRCRSVVSISEFEASEPRRKSCDVVVSARSSLSNLFDVNDGSDGDTKVESKNVVGLSRVTYTVIEPSEKKKNQDEIRFSNNKFTDDREAQEEEEEGEGEFKTMKEYIDLEFQSKTKKSKDFREIISGNFFGAASVFSKKLRKWRQKNNNNNKIKMPNISSNDEKSCVDSNGNLKSFQLGESHSEIVGRRSCDTEEPPRFSIDAGRISFEEPRASWDGYMIARTIPRLAPMFSVVENGVLGNINKFENHRLSVDGPMHSIIEDESSSGVSGHSNSDSSSSMRRSSFDRSSSVRSFAKKAMNSEDHGASPANVKLVITEKELKDWHLTSSKVDDSLEKFGAISVSTASTDGVCNVNALTKKSVRWRKVCNVFGFRTKDSENVNEIVAGNVIDPFIGNTNEKQEMEDGGNLKDITGCKLTRCSSVVGSRNACNVMGSTYRRRSVDNAGEFKLERNTSTKYSSTELGDAILPFYMTPLRSTRNSKSGKFKLQNSHPIAVALILRIFSGYVNCGIYHKLKDAGILWRQNQNFFITTHLTELLYVPFFALKKSCGSDVRLLDLVNMIELFLERPRYILMLLCNIFWRMRKTGDALSYQFLLPPDGVATLYRFLLKVHFNIPMSNEMLKLLVICIQLKWAVLPVQFISYSLELPLERLVAKECEVSLLALSWK